jgi:hypothetical protein
MGEVVQLRDYQRKDEPKPETVAELQVQYNIQRSARLQGAPIKDTAPSEYSAPVDGDCA